MTTIEDENLFICSDHLNLLLCELPISILCWNLYHYLFLASLKKQFIHYCSSQPSKTTPSDFTTWYSCPSSWGLYSPLFWVGAGISYLLLKKVYNKSDEILFLWLGYKKPWFPFYWYSFCGSFHMLALIKKSSWHGTEVASSQQSIRN